MNHSRRNVLKGASVLVAGPWLQRLALSEARDGTGRDPARQSPEDNPMDLVNPEFRAGLAKFDTSSSLNAQTLQSARADERKAAPTSVPSGVSEKLVPGAAGAPKVRVFVFGNSPGASKPAILHIHGGGFVLGSAAITGDEIEAAKLLNCAVVSVDYRLAPETKFPGSLEDNYAALRWMNENARQLGIDPNRIAVKGESAGGGHAAMLALTARDRREFTLCKQVLIYPMLDDRTGSTRKVPSSIGHYIWTPQENRFGWTSLLGIPAGSRNVPANSAPARVRNLEGLPPAFIGVGSIDLFAPEDIDYSRRLLETGISTELMVVPGAYHGFDILSPDAPLSREFRTTWISALRRTFARSRT